MSVWFITGASRGLGMELATSALAHGDQVIAAGRDPGAVAGALPQAGEALLAVQLDVTDQGQATAAVAAGTEALRAELAPLGIRVTVVEPGSFRTEFLTVGSRRQAKEAIADYDGTVGKLRDVIQASNGHQPGDPVKAAAAIRQLAAIPEPPLRLPLGSDCVTLVEGKLDSVARELGQWRDLALSRARPPLCRST